MDRLHPPTKAKSRRLGIDRLIDQSVVVAVVIDGGGGGGVGFPPAVLAQSASHLSLLSECLT